MPSRLSPTMGSEGASVHGFLKKYRILPLPMRVNRHFRRIKGKGDPVDGPLVGDVVVFPPLNQVFVDDDLGLPEADGSGRQQIQKKNEFFHFCIHPRIQLWFGNL